jgi:hypothetical protein
MFMKIKEKIKLTGELVTESKGWEIPAGAICGGS